MRRRLCHCVLAVVIVMGVVAAAQAGTRRQHATSIHLYAPFNGDAVASGIRIAKTVRGYCWTISLSDWRSDAYRCLVGNEIHDPCFANGIDPTGFVLCPLYLPTSKVLRIDLTKPLPAGHAGGDPTVHPPWALQLANGMWCEMLSGATGTIAGMRINYGCTDGHSTLIGNPRRGTPTWTIFAAKSDTASSYQPVAIRAAWW